MTTCLDAQGLTITLLRYHNGKNVTLGREKGQLSSGPAEA